jgi:ribosomal-protein-alanine N-acetyltransferase
MGNRGRFGKYGETKRLNRLRGAGTIDVHHRRSRAGEDTPSKEVFHRKARFASRPAGRSDKGFIAQLSGKVFSVYGPYRDMVSQWFATGLTVTRIGLMGGAPVGFAMVGRWLQENEAESVCELLAIAVEPDRQHQGLGRRLLQEIETEAEQRGERALFLHTALENLPAQKLFSKAGYRPCGIKRKFYPAGQHALMMCKDMQKGAPKGE